MQALHSHDDGQPFAGPHPTNREFVAQLRDWGFTERREDGVHLILRGPHGGTLRVVRSQLGRADGDKVAKAARLINVTVERFWAGPEGASPTSDLDSTVHRSRRTPRDQVTSLVLGIHTEQDRPLGFDQVVELLGHAVAREQVRSASAQLCRDGDLDRVRSGVYQWANGTRAQATTSPTIAPHAPSAAPESSRISTEALFRQLFPSGVQMTAELWPDLERWVELTEKLASHAA